MSTLVPVLTFRGVSGLPCLINIISDHLSSLIIIMRNPVVAGDTALAGVDVGETAGIAEVTASQKLR